MSQTIILLLAIGVVAAVAYSDIRTRRIPNELVVAIFVLAVLRIAIAAAPNTALYTLAGGAAVFVAAFLLFWRGLLGAGDAKLLTAISLFVGSHELLHLLLLTAFCTAFLALCTLAVHRLGPSLALIPLCIGLCRAPPHLTALAGRQVERCQRWLPGGHARPGGADDRFAVPSVPYGVAIAAAGGLLLVIQFSVSG